MLAAAPARIRWLNLITFGSYPSLIIGPVLISAHHFHCLAIGSEGDLRMMGMDRSDKTHNRHLEASCRMTEYTCSTAVTAQAFGGPKVDSPHYSEKFNPERIREPGATQEP